MPSLQEKDTTCRNKAEMKRHRTVIKCGKRMQRNHNELATRAAGPAHCSSAGPYSDRTLAFNRLSMLSFISKQLKSKENDKMHFRFFIWYKRRL